MKQTQLELEEKIKKEIGNKIKTIRLSNKIDQKGLAKAIETDQGSISHYESGHKELSIINLYRIATALQSPFTDFLSSELTSTTNNTFHDQSIQTNNGAVHHSGSMNFSFPIPKSKEDFDALMSFMKKAGELTSK